MKEQDYIWQRELVASFNGLLTENNDLREETLRDYFDLGAKKCIMFFADVPWDFAAALSVVASSDGENFLFNEENTKLTAFLAALGEGEEGEQFVADLHELLHWASQQPGLRPNLWGYQPR